MTEGLEFVIRAVLVGIGATAVLDLWVQFTKRVLGLPGSNWGRVGRWFGHFPRDASCTTILLRHRPFAASSL